MSNTIRLTPAQSLAIRDLAEDNSLQITTHGRTLDSLEAKKLIFRDVNDTRYTQRYYLTEAGKELRVQELRKQAVRDTKAAKAIPVVTVVTEALLAGDDATIEQLAESFAVVQEADRNVTEVERVFHINDKVVDRHDGAVGTVESRYSDGRVGIVLKRTSNTRVVPMSRLEPLAELHTVHVVMNSREFSTIPFGTAFEVQGSQYNSVTEDWGVQLYSPQLDRTLQAISRESLEQYFKAV